MVVTSRQKSFVKSPSSTTSRTAAAPAHTLVAESSTKKLTSGGALKGEGSLDAKASHAAKCSVFVCASNPALPSYCSKKRHLRVRLRVRVRVRVRGQGEG